MILSCHSTKYEELSQYITRQQVYNLVKLWDSAVQVTFCHVCLVSIGNHCYQSFVVQDSITQALCLTIFHENTGLQLVQWSIMVVLTQPSLSHTCVTMSECEYIVCLCVGIWNMLGGTEQRLISVDIIYQSFLCFVTKSWSIAMAADIVCVLITSSHYILLQNLALQSNLMLHQKLLIFRRLAYMNQP